MMAALDPHIRPPSIGFLRWLVDPGPGVPEEVRGILLWRLLTRPAPFILGVINSMLVSAVALGMKGGLVFAGYLALDVLLGMTRVAVTRGIDRALARGGKPEVNAYLMVGILWCALQGAIALTAILSGRPTLELLSTVAVFGIVGPLCARNYPAPRYCMLLIMLCDFPFVAGCVLSGSHWLLITLAETPLFLLGCHAVIRTFQHLAIDTLNAAMESQHRATHDPLTGLSNRRGFQEAITHHAGKDTPCLGILALDLDGFKAVNDLRGHHVGDALLEAVARRLSARVRPLDSVVRLGGDEFVVLLDNVTFAEARALAERLIEDIGNAPYRIDGGPLVRVGVSIGIACSPEDGREIELVHRRADAALYEAKTAGRGIWRRFVRSVEETVAAD
jgi:diguanylate cyclase (GGDEF)-like protein